MDITIITPVLDFAMYEKCIANNPNLTATKEIALDNRKDNEYISVIYNRFLDNYDYSIPSWFVFCHEDFQPIENIGTRICSLQKDAIYGPIGSRLAKRSSVFIPGGLWQTELVGEITESDKSGNEAHKLGMPVAENTIVDTLDCQCLIMHSSLIAQFKLRFDTNLSFDLYVEDFCASAKLNHGILSRIIPLQCRHWSRGSIADRFHLQRDYLFRKYPKSEFASTTGYSIGAGRTRMRRFQLRTRRFLDKNMACVTQSLLRMASATSHSCTLASHPKSPDLFACSDSVRLRPRRSSRISAPRVSASPDETDPVQRGRNLSDETQEKKSCP